MKRNYILVLALTAIALAVPHAGWSGESSAGHSSMADMSGMPMGHAHMDMHEDMMDMGEGDAVRGKQLALLQCAGCHGKDGVSISDEIPSLAGQLSMYLQDALMDYRMASRSAPPMNSAASGLTDSDISDLSAYYSALPHFSNAQANGVAAGSNDTAYYLCSGCHGPSNLRANHMSPELLGQKSAYIVAKLHDYREGRRTHPYMTGVAKSLSDEDIQQLAQYFSGHVQQECTSASWFSAVWCYRYPQSSR